MTEQKPEPEQIDDGSPLWERDPKAAREYAKLIAELEADPNSTQGTISYSPGNDPAEQPDPEPSDDDLTDLQRLERTEGFTFGSTDTGPKPTIALICRIPECDRNGQHIAVHHDTEQPITCGGTITTATGQTRPCGAVLLCDHTTETTETTEGTFAAPVKTTLTICTKCRTITSKTTEQLPPINLADLPVSILNQLSDTPTATP